MSATTEPTPTKKLTKRQLRKLERGEVKPQIPIQIDLPLTTIYKDPATEPEMKWLKLALGLAHCKESMVLTVPEVAKLFAMSEQGVIELINLNLLESIRAGQKVTGHHRIFLSSVLNHAWNTWSHRSLATSKQIKLLVITHLGAFDNSDLLEIAGKALELRKSRKKKPVIAVATPSPETSAK